MLQADDDRASPAPSESPEGVDLAQRFEELTGWTVVDAAPVVMKIALNYTGGNRVDAQDLAQEAWAKIARGIRDGQIKEPIENPPAWLRVTVKRLGIDHYRQSRRSKRMAETQCLVTVDERHSPVSPEPSPDELSIKADLSRRLHVAVAGLPAELRAVVELVLQGRTYREISGLLGVPEGTIKTRAIRARILLKSTPGLADGGE